MKKLLLTAFITSQYCLSFSQNTQLPINLDVLSYDIQLEPNIKDKSIIGMATITFIPPSAGDKITFSCGNLLVDSVHSDCLKNFTQSDGILTLNLKKGKEELIKVVLYFSGNPKKGLLFDSKQNQAYTVFHSNEWMVCNMQPNDRASISLELIIPDSLNSIANGNLISKQKHSNNTTSHLWEQEQETPSYTFGFVIGEFNSSQKIWGKTTLSFYSPYHSQQQLDRIFQYTPDMMQFFEEKSGIPYPQNSYNQVLIGNHYQEMSGFAVLKHSYGSLILEDSTETNLISHELAHQWWGNMITCQNWNHFWLNEGFATFMSAAFNEYKFGKEKYEADINSYYEVYLNIKDKGFDKPLVFSNWENPTRFDRNLVYFKGAYVLHLLRMEIGDESFWKAIKYYSTKYYGKTVTTLDFKSAIEESSNQNLDNFFEQWIY